MKKPATNGGNTTSNNTVIMNYTLYKGNNNVTGELLNVYVNGKYTNSIRHVIVSEITIVIKCILYTVSEGKML